MGKKTIFALVFSVMLIFSYFMSPILAEGDAPQLLSVIPNRDNGLLLTWEPSYEAIQDMTDIKYYVLRSIDGISFQAIASRDPSYGTYFLDATDLIPGKQYFYKVREFRNDVQIGESNILAANAESTPSPSNEFYDEESATEYLKQQMILREKNISIIYNAPSFPSGLSQRLYDAARIDTESCNPSTSTSGDYLRLTIIPGTFKAVTGIDGKVGTMTSYTFSFTLDYYTSREDELLVDEKVEEILGLFALEGITADSPEYMRVKAVNDWFCNNVSYNNGKREDNGNLMITAYDSLVRGESQCYGEVLGCYRLLKELGIVTRRVNGTTSVELTQGNTQQKNHAWNLVKIGDVWYDLDVTAAASYHEINQSTGGGSRLYTYRYMLQGSDSSGFSSHVRTGEYAEDSFISSHPMSDSSFPVEPVAPEAPVLTLTENCHVSGTFQAVEGVSGYAVYRDVAPEGSFDLVMLTQTPSFIDDTVSPGNEYHYKICSYMETEYGTVLYSAYSPRRIIKVKGPGPDLGITGLQTVPSSYNSVMIAWDEVTDAEFYAVYRSESEDGTYKLLTNTLTENTFTSRSLATGTTYYYKVKAGKLIDGTKMWGDYSDIVSATPKLSAPTGVTATPSSSSTVDMHWEKVEGASYYQVYRMPSPNGKLALLGVYDENTFNSVSRKLAANTTYYYKVRCYRWVNGERVFSPFSTVVSATTF